MSATLCVAASELIWLITSINQHEYSVFNISSDSFFESSEYSIENLKIIVILTAIFFHLFIYNSVFIMYQYLFSMYFYTPPVNEYLG